MIVQKMRESGEMETEEIMDLIRPHYIFDPQTAKEQMVRRKANQLMSQIKDENGARTVFNCKVDGVSKYVNIDESRDVASLRSVDRQLSEKLDGLKISSAKASRRRAELEGQLSLDLAAM
ncbi:hypothetical protein [Faecalicatena contorta]|uniref:hypothetical protein n=1 Tax=Faecalicatena contorta TaxID=39482 RepID=UPI003216F593